MAEGAESQAETRPDESEKERLDRNLLELLNELRVALPGVQVLFAFLLTVPFTQRFSTLTSTQEKVYYATLLLTTVSTVLLIAPSAHHRINFRQQDKAYIVFLANRLTIAGLALPGARDVRCDVPDHRCAVRLHRDGRRGGRRAARVRDPLVRDPDLATPAARRL